MSFASWPAVQTGIPRLSAINVREQLESETRAGVVVHDMAKPRPLCLYMIEGQ